MRRPARSSSSPTRRCGAERSGSRSGRRCSWSAACRGRRFGRPRGRPGSRRHLTSRQESPSAGIEIFERTLAAYPGNPNVLYNLACFEALAGRVDDALEHLAQAAEADPRTREWAQTDSDFDAIRSDPRFPVA